MWARFVGAIVTIPAYFLFVMWIIRKHVDLARTSRLRASLLGAAIVLGMAMLMAFWDSVPVYR